MRNTSLSRVEVIKERLREIFYTFRTGILFSLDFLGQIWVMWEARPKACPQPCAQLDWVLIGGHVPYAIILYMSHSSEYPTGLFRTNMCYTYFKKQYTKDEFLLSCSSAKIIRHAILQLVMQQILLPNSSITVYHILISWLALL